MTDVEVTGNKVRVLFYAIVMLLSLGYMGAVSELCSTDGRVSCGDSRLAGVIAMGVLTFILCVGGAAVAALNLPLLVEAPLIALAFLFNTTATGLLTSPKTIAPLTLLALLAWMAELSLVVAAFLLAASVAPVANGKQYPPTSSQQGYATVPAQPSVPTYAATPTAAPVLPTAVPVPTGATTITVSSDA